MGLPIAKMVERMIVIASEGFQLLCGGYRCNVRDPFPVPSGVVVGRRTDFIAGLD